MCARFDSKDKSDRAKNCGICINYNFQSGKCMVVEQIKEDAKDGSSYETKKVKATI